MKASSASGLSARNDGKKETSRVVHDLDPIQEMELAVIPVETKTIIATILWVPWVLTQTL